MDNLTHGLLGLAIAACRRPGGARQAGAPATDAPSTSAPSAILRRFSPTDRAVLLASFVAAELPDLDTLWPAPDEVLHALRAHRGWTHSLVAAPLVAAIATAIACLIWRRARAGPVYGVSLLAVVLGHLLCDAWTGWGTRLFLPFSDARLALDWTVVVDPFFTGPLVIAGVVALVRRLRWRRALMVGLAVATAYLGFRVASRQVLLARVEAAYPHAERVAVFPALLAVARWRWVAVLPGEYVAGEVPLVGPPEEQARHAVGARPGLDPALRQVPTVREALAWARFPVIDVTDAAGGGRTIRIADLRYHLRGEPTLAFVLDVDPTGRVVSAHLDRGSPQELLRRWRGDPR